MYGRVRCVREIIPELLGDQVGENVGYIVGNMCQGRSTPIISM